MESVKSSNAGRIFEVPQAPLEKSRASCRGVSQPPLPLREGLGEGLGVPMSLKFRFDHLRLWRARPCAGPSLGR